MMGWQWHQLNQMQAITLLQKTTTQTPHQSGFYGPDALPDTQPTASKHWRHSPEPENCKNWNLYTSKIKKLLPVSFKHNRHQTNHISEPYSKFGENRKRIMDVIIRQPICSQTHKQMEKLTTGSIYCTGYRQWALSSQGKSPTGLNLSWSTTRLLLPVQWLHDARTIYIRLKKHSQTIKLPSWIIMESIVSVVDRLYALEDLWKTANAD